MLEDYQVTDPDGVDDAAQETSWTLELFHQRLAASAPELEVTRVDDDRATLRLRLRASDDDPGATVVWPVSLPRGAAEQTLNIDEDPAWPTVSPLNVTPFIAVETTAGDGEARVTRRCVIEATLVGDVDHRRRDAVAEVLRTRDDVLRYLVFLLGDPAYNALFEQLTGAGERRYANAEISGTRADIALFEPLVRATGRDEDALARVASHVEELRQLPNGEELVPEGFQDLWEVVWTVHQEARQ
jgi:hypothetical protein